MFTGYPAMLIFFFFKEARISALCQLFPAYMHPRGDDHDEVCSTSNKQNWRAFRLPRRDRHNWRATRIGNSLPMVLFVWGCKSPQRLFHAGRRNLPQIDNTPNPRGLPNSQFIHLNDLHSSTSIKAFQCLFIERWMSEYEGEFWLNNSGEYSGEYSGEWIGL